MFDWLYSHDQPRDTVTSDTSVLRSLDEKCKILLSAFSGKCTHQLIHEARIQHYGKDYTTYHHNNNNTTHYESLLALDRMGHVCNDTEAIEEFEECVRTFIHWLLETFWAKPLPAWDKGPAWRPFWLENFDIRRIGSFPCDTKVGDLDEFDYLCVVDVNDRGWKYNNVRKGGDGGWAGMVVSRGERFPWEFLSHCTDLLRPHTTPDTSTPHVSDLLKHGPAACVRLSWPCGHGHAHTVSIDLSLAIQATPGRPYLNVCGERNFPPWTPSSCCSETEYLDELEQKVSSHIRPLFRCLKLIIRLLLPQQLIESKDSPRGWRLADIVTSHQLKCAVFKEVHLHQDQGDWVAEKLVKRAVGVLESLQRVEERHGCRVWPVCWDVILQEDVSTVNPDTEIFKHTTPQQIIQSLIQHMQGDVQHMQGDVQHMQGDVPIINYDVPTIRGDVTYMIHDSPCVVYLKGTTGHLHKGVLDRAIVLPRNKLVHAYIVPADPRGLHPLLLWCTQYVTGLYRANQGVDLTRIPQTDLRHVWGLVYGGTVNQSDVAGDRYQSKLGRLRALMGSYDTAGKRLWEMYIKGCHCDPPPPHITDYLSQTDVTMVTDLETILSFGMYKLTVGEVGLGYREKVRIERAERRKILGRLERGGHVVREWLAGVEDKHCVYLAIHHLLVNYT